MPRAPRKSWEQAFDHLKEAIELHDADRYLEALDAVDKSIEKVKPGGGVFWAAKSRILYSLDRVEEAENAARLATEIDPKVRHGWVVLGQALKEQKRFKDAAAALAKANEIEQDFNILTIQAAVELQFDPDLALKHAKRALELNPDWEEARAIAEEAERMLE